MSQLSLKCPNCQKELCVFSDGKLFAHCNKCGSTIERDLKNNVKVFDKNKEQDENIIFANERTEECASLELPTREKFDIESFDYEVEKIMDNLMTFNEVMKDIFESMKTMDEHQKLRTCELCCSMVDRIFNQYKPFIQEYEDYGMYDELSDTYNSYTTELKKLSSEFSSKMDNAIKEYWSTRQDEYNELQKQLVDAKNRKSRTLMFDLRANWEIDNEIAAIEEKLNQPLNDQ